jgi:acyl carrier protein
MPRLSQTEIERVIKRILTADLAVDPAALAGIDERTPLLGRGIALDSVETVGLALGLEQAFDIQIPDGDLTDDLFEDLGALVDYVARRVGEQPGEREGRASR